MKYTAHFAIVGCGMAGLASALFLLRDGHRVTLFERFATPQAIGAGILLQPTGLHVLQQLGLLDEILSRGARITSLQGLNQHGHKVMDVHYAHLHASLYGVGIHRGSLFTCLYNAANAAGANIHCDTAIQNFVDKQQQSFLQDDRGQHHGPYDAVIVANGTQSSLRRQLGIKQRYKPYPWGALWAILDDPQQQFTSILEQRYHGAHKMIGILPSGRHPQTGQPCVSFFWSLPAAEYPAWREHNTDLSNWKQQLLRDWPALDSLIQPLTTPQDLTLASYGDVVMQQWHHANRLCIGDAAHGMSPQLGQGTNLALFDAMVLAQNLRHNDSIPQAFANYSQQRRAHLRFYQFASRWLTPLFQSHSHVGAVLRDLSFPLMQKIPFTYREALRTVSGVKTGWLLDADIITTTRNH